MTPMEQSCVEVVAREIHLARWNAVGSSPEPFDRDAALIWYGMLIAQNGMVSIEEIVKAARETWDRERPGQYTDDARFFRAVAIEALGGAKVSEEYGELYVAVTDHGTLRPGQRVRGVLWGEVVVGEIADISRTGSLQLDTGDHKGWRSAHVSQIAARPFSVPLLTIER